MTNKEPSKVEKTFVWLFLWGARLALGVLAFAGGVHFLSGIDPTIAWLFAGGSVAFLLKETL